MDEAEQTLKDDPKVKVIFANAKEKEEYDWCVEVKDGDGVEVAIDGTMIWIKVTTKTDGVAETREIMSKIKKQLKGKVTEGKILIKLRQSKLAFTVAYCVLNHLIKLTGPSTLLIDASDL